MSAVKKIQRLSKVAREFNVGISTIIDFLETQNIKIEANPNSKISEDIYNILMVEYSSDIQLKEESKQIKFFQDKEEIEKQDEKITQAEEEKVVEDEQHIEIKTTPKPELIKPSTPKPKEEVKVVGKIDLGSINQKTRPDKKTKEEVKKEKEESKKLLEKLQKKEDEKEPKKEKKEENLIKTEKIILSAPEVKGKIDLPEKSSEVKKRKRRRIKKSRIDISEVQKERSAQKGKPRRKKQKPRHEEISEEAVQQQIKETLSRLTKTKSKSVKYRKEKRVAISQKKQEEEKELEKEKKILKLTEFVSVSELAKMMDISPNDIISTCMSLGLFVSINQRLDAETIVLVAGEFDYDVKFVSAEILDEFIEEETDAEEDLKERPPIVTVMGHVDHGKTSLLDYIRKTNVIAGEAGGITQHIGAYHVILENERSITFLDTPGHEAFTAMRARGAQATDLAIIVIAADDNVMPQTKEAINHASAAGVPIVFAINKIDKPGANAEKIKEELSKMKYLVEDWGGKYQSQEISAKQGTNIDDLLEKVLLEAELLELKSNPNKKASGTVLDSTLDKGKGYVTKILVQKGTLKIGDVILAGIYTGTVKAMFNERSQKIESAGPSHPALILGFNGAPQSGDYFHVLNSDKEARQIATKREQLQREQTIRTRKHITLNEIGRRIAIGNFQELKIVVKGDVDGSIEALSDALIKLSTDEIQVQVIHKGVGQISESDVMLATASNAIIIGFQVRPSVNARVLAEKEQIDIRLYSIIYNAIEEVKQAMEGMLSPDLKENVLGSTEVLEIFKITKVGTVAGCIVRDGKINRNAQIRIIREGIVIYTGKLGSLKRFKEDVKEVSKGFECGLNIENYNDIKVGDIIETFEEVEVKKTL